MSQFSDGELLEQFVRYNSETAFSTLVERHLPLVHSVALRQTEDSHDAQDISQAVFMILAQKASTLRTGTILPGWLYHTARLTAANFLRAKWRRARREQEAAMEIERNDSAPDPVWRELSPHLELAMTQLNPTDRDALVLRFFQNRSMAEVGTALGWTQNTAQQRVGRALEKLRKVFARRGCVVGVTALAGVLSANAVQAAPTGLTGAVATGALSSGAAAGSSTFTIAKGVLKTMAWTKAKTAVVTTVGLLMIGGVSTVTWTTFFMPRIVFSSFGATEKFDRRNSWAIYSDKPGKRETGYRAQGEWFLSTINGRLKTVEVAMRPSRNGGAINLSVAEDENGIPGKALERFSVSPSAVGRQPTLVLQSTTRPKMQSGKKYWLCAEPADSSSQWSWSFNNQKLAKGFAFEREQGKWSSFEHGPNNGAFSITVSP
jgi:RNA polymerase sigma factor (sigma-70 family)